MTKKVVRPDYSAVTDKVPAIANRFVTPVIKRAHWAFYWKKYTCINLADVCTC